MIKKLTILIPPLCCIFVLCNVVSMHKTNYNLIKEINKMEQLVENTDKDRYDLLKRYNELYKNYEQSIENQYDTIEYSIGLIEQVKSVDKELYMKLYLQIVDDWEESPPEKIEDVYSEDEVTYMLKCIETECYDCDFDSKVDVACVIINRLEHDLFPPNPIDLITDENQFAYGRNVITEDTKLALEYAWMIEDTTNGCIGFRSDKQPKEWNGWIYSFTDKAGHHFYKTKEQ